MKSSRMRNYAGHAERVIGVSLFGGQAPPIPDMTLTGEGGPVGHYDVSGTTGADTTSLLFTGADGQTWGPYTDAAGDIFTNTFTFPQWWKAVLTATGPGGTRTLTHYFATGADGLLAQTAHGPAIPGATATMGSVTYHAGTGTNDFGMLASWTLPLRANYENATTINVLRNGSSAGAATAQDASYLNFNNSLGAANVTYAIQYIFASNSALPAANTTSGTFTVPLEIPNTPSPLNTMAASGYTRFNWGSSASTPAGCTRGNSFSDSNFDGTDGQSDQNFGFATGQSGTLTGITPNAYASIFGRSFYQNATGRSAFCTSASSAGPGGEPDPTAAMSVSLHGDGTIDTTVDANPSGSSVTAEPGFTNSVVIDVDGSIIYSGATVPSTLNFDGAGYSEGPHTVTITVNQVFDGRSASNFGTFTNTGGVISVP